MKKYLFAVLFFCAVSLSAQVQTFFQIEPREVIGDTATFIQIEQVVRINLVDSTFYFDVTAFNVDTTRLYTKRNLQEVYSGQSVTVNKIKTWLTNNKNVVFVP